MAIDFNALLTVEQKLGLLKERIAGFAAEAYQHELNKQVATNIGNSDEVQKADTALAILEMAISVHQAEEASLKTEQEDSNG